MACCCRRRRRCRCRRFTGQMLSRASNNNSQHNSTYHLVSIFCYTRYVCSAVQCSVRDNRVDDLFVWTVWLNVWLTGWMYICAAAGKVWGWCDNKRSLCYMHTAHWCVWTTKGGESGVWALRFGASPFWCVHGNAGYEVIRRICHTVVVLYDTREIRKMRYLAVSLG